MKMEKSDNIILSLILISVIAVIGATAYKFLIQKDYDFYVEALCDPATETCYYRDCSTEECPPNELEYYKILLVSAGDFEKCSDNSCLVECTNGSIICEEIVCDEQGGDECALISDVSEIIEWEDENLTESESDDSVGE